MHLERLADVLAWRADRSKFITPMVVRTMALADLLKRRRQFVDMCVAEQNRLAHPGQRAARSIASALKLLDKQVESIASH